MELYSSSSYCTSHCIRIVLAEKELDAVIHDVNPDDPPADLMELNPYQSVPTLVDRELVLYDYRVIMEYLDERFPHPPLLPPDPINRARFRMALTRINEDWYSLLPKLDSDQNKEYQQTRQILQNNLVAAASVFRSKSFFLSEEFSLLDCSMGPLLWRLQHYSITLPPSAGSILDYAHRLFERASFQRSLSTVEKRMRD
jgi:RNA polymerase-associated protein